jgi:glucokinase
MTTVALGVDLGGTNLRAAVVSDAGDIVDEVSHPTLAKQGPDAVIKRIAEAIAEVASRAGVPADVPIGVAAPGPLDPRAGIVHFAPNLPGWIDIPLSTRLEALTGRNVFLGNDANAAALGELYFGAGRGTRNLVYVGIGTGVGGGVISEGILIDGVRGMGAELGHVCVSMDGPRCTCGSTGCIESYCSSWAIRRDAEILVASGRGNMIAEAAGSRRVGTRAVNEAARKSDPDALALLERAGYALGTGLGNFINIFNPEVIVIGGGVAEIGEPLLGPARRAMAAHSIPAIHHGVRVIPSALGVKTGTYGAAALVFYAQA